MTSILKDHSILYVEDEPSIRANIVEYLESYFDTVYTASDGAQALELYNKHRPDIAMLDINLPYMDGLTVAREIRSQDEKIKLVMLTAFTDKEKLLQATELKLTKYLVKPVAPKLFKSTMQLLADELSSNPSKFYNLGDGYLWNRESKKLSLHDTSLHLSIKEHTLLTLLLDKRPTLVTYEDIMVACWEDAFEREISIDSVKNLVSNLRKKLPEGCIESVYGQGYILH